MSVFITTTSIGLAPTSRAVCSVSVRGTAATDALPGSGPRRQGLPSPQLLLDVIACALRLEPERVAAKVDGFFAIFCTREVELVAVFRELVAGVE